MKFEDPPEIIGAGKLRKPALTGANPIVLGRGQRRSESKRLHN